jgi:type II secretory pathway pseudopilin PulG
VIFSKAKRSGITLIEVIVVMGLLLMLAAMLAPFFARTRGQAAQLQAANNLRQIGIAVHNHSDNYKRLPPTAGVGPNGRRGSALYHVLPFVEQLQLYDRGTVWEGDSIGVVVPIYLDQRDTTAPGNKYQDWLATSSYAANWLAFKRGEAGIHNGFPDGTSNTIMFAERYQVCNDTPCAWAYDELYYWAPMIGYYSLEKFQTLPKNVDCNPALAQALDSSAALVVMADASTRRLGDKLSSSTWYRALDPNDGLPNGPDFDD